MAENRINVGLESIDIDCFYNGKLVKDKKSPLFKKFSHHILEEIKAKFVIAAHKRGLTFSQTFVCSDGKQGMRQRNITNAIQIATTFCQVSKLELQANLPFYRNKLYDVLYEDFGPNWDKTLENKVMTELGYCYSEEHSEEGLKELGVKKGDVRKLITAKYREEKKYIIEKIESYHGTGTLNISRSRINGGSVDGKLVRGGRNKRKFYVNATTRKVITE
jgi:hypothetical protein